MTQVWFYSLAGVLMLGLVSFSGAITLTIKQKYLKGFLLFLVSFAAGTLLGDVFIHLLPELVEEGGFSLSISLYILLGILIFFVLEKIVHWRHCHMAATSDHIHPLGAMNLIGEVVHSLIDGALIAGSFVLSVPIGIATTIAVAMHEIPQEMGDFGILVHSGMSVKRALLYNFLASMVSIVGVALVLGLGLEAEQIIGTVIPIAIGGFLYIANSDLIPELHKEVKPSRSLVQLISLLAGVGVMALLLLMEAH